MCVTKNYGPGESAEEQLKSFSIFNEKLKSFVVVVFPTVSEVHNMEEWGYLLYKILIPATTNYNDPVCFQHLMQNFLTYEHFVSNNTKMCSSGGNRTHSE